MSDLVNRLRGQYEVGPDGEYELRDFSDFIPPISLEAADRIEDLDKKLDQAIDMLDTNARAHLLAEWAKQ